MSMRWSTRANAVAFAVVLIWAAAAATGFANLLRYKSTPGQVDGSPPARWPSESRVQPAAGRATLVLFAHPHCPCTHASVSELARLMARVSDRLVARVVIVRPAGVEQDWNDTELLRRAASIEGATLSRDEGAVEAARFRATVSGFTVVYDASGRLRFAGGITSARGHEGDSFGRQRILAVLSGQGADRQDAPVFGCSLGIAPHGPESMRLIQQEGS